MSHPGGMATVILAAGRSSRMGTPKPLLPLGSRSLIERVVETVSRAGVNDIVIVTGHEPETLARALSRLPVRTAHNPQYDLGMFSSVRAGVAALRPDVEAFFVLPADCPLVRTQVLERLIDEFRAARETVTDATRDTANGAVCHTPGRTSAHASRSAPGIFHATCCGLRGHPPLLANHYRGALLDTSPNDNLRSFFLRHAEDEVEVEVEDLTILFDMDTPDDYARLRRFAAILEQGEHRRDRRSTTTRVPSASASSVLSDDDALHLLRVLDVPERVVRHCQAVAQVGAALATALLPHQPSLNVDLVRSAGLLHDIARASTTPRQHAQVGARLLANLGLSQLSAIIDVHMVLPSEQVDTPAVSEAQLVYLADKLVAEDKVVTLEERTTRTLAKLGGAATPPEAREGIRGRMETAQRIYARVERLLGHPLIEVLNEITIASPIKTMSQAHPTVHTQETTGIANHRSSTEKLIYLVRHAQPELPDNRKRFVGTSDPPLSATGIEQARRLADELRPLKFDSAYSSDLRRCLQTAAIITEDANPPVPIRPTPQLREIDAGWWEWLTFEEAEINYPEEYEERERDLVGYRFPGGESFQDLRERVLPAFFEILDGGGTTILVVAHLGVNRVLLSEFLGLPLEELFSVKLGYGATTVIRALPLPDGSRKIEVVG